MPRLTKIYTRHGDEGLTKLSSGHDVYKDSARVAAYGTVDELSSHIGVALTLNLDKYLVGKLAKIQNDLFHLGSDLSFRFEDEAERNIPQIEARHVDALELILDETSARVGPLENFILPGGAPGAAQLHVARTVCRRAERVVIALSREEMVGPNVIPYLNRLSDALFNMARFENFQKGVAEPQWDSRI